MAIITISRGAYSDGADLAECVAGGLGYPCYSSANILKEVASRYGVPMRSSILESQPGLGESHQTVKLARKRYVACATATLARQARKHNLVFHGEGGHLLLKDVPGITKVRVIGDTESRIAAAMRENQLARDKATELIKKLDQDRAKWLQSVFRIDWVNSFHYDLVIDFRRTSITEACNMIVVMIKARPETPVQFRQKMEDFALSAEVFAEIITSKEIGDSALETIEVEADGGAITLRGRPESSAEEDRIKKVAASVPGVSEIVTQLERPQVQHA